MSVIDRELITNKPNCYIFDIDGCLADISHILLTYRQTLEIKIRNYNEAIEKYNNDIDLYNRQMKEYNKGLIDEPIEPIKPEKPNEYIDEKKLDKIDWDYFRDHLIEAVPIQGILDLFTCAALSYKVIILTGRFDKYRLQTIEWLKKVIIDKKGNDLYRRINFQLIMRSDKETELSDVKYKRSKIIEISKQYNIQLVIEDSPEIIKEYTDLGLLVLSPNREYYKVG